jgi:hypothetical protein
MAIPLSGQISVSTISDEFGGTVPHSLSEYYRGAGLVPTSPQNSLIPSSGALPMGSFYGSADRPVIPLVISADTTNYDAYTNFINSPAYPSYVAGLSTISITVNPGVVVNGTSPTVYALSIPSAFNPGDGVTLTNNGTIAGKGGNGGNGGGSTNPTVAGSPGAAGGNALYINRPVTITNNGILAGGGGGGGGGATATIVVPIATTRYAPGGGGGGGGGITAGTGGSGNVPGTPGTVTSGGPGGAGDVNVTPVGTITGGAGGSGGARGAAGSGGAPTGSGGPGGGGGAAGKYVVGSPFVTWDVTGNRYGGAA